MDMHDDYSAWDLFRRGQIDQRKHLKILERIIKDNITDLIVHGKIIAGDNVALPVKHLKQWRFVYEPKKKGTIVVPGSGKKKKGDVIAEKPKKGTGSGSGGDGQGGEGQYEVVVNADKISEYLFENMELPRMKRKSSKDVYKEYYKMDSISRKGSVAKIHKRKTIYENIKRNASKGAAVFKNILDPDLRYRSHSVKRIPQDKIIAIFIRDRSASMDITKKELTRIMAFWFSQFLEYKYSKMIEKQFILFDTDAAQVTEDDFYSISEGGGTIISSGLQVAREMIDSTYPSNFYNIYVFVFTDGDNFPYDNDKALNLSESISYDSNLLGFCHINTHSTVFRNLGGESEFISKLKVMSKDTEIIEVGSVKERNDIVNVMKQFFGKGDK